MKVNIDIRSNHKVRAFYLFFIISSLQIGVGIMGAPKYIFKEAQQDSWLSILIATIYIIIVVFAMIFILEQYESADIFGIQVDVFGQWIGKLLGIIYIAHFIITLFSILITYTEVIQIFLFPSLPTFIIPLLMMSLAVYSVQGGFKIIVGVAFLCFITTQWILLFLYDPITRMEWHHFTPMFQASLPELLAGARQTTYSFLGFHILFLVYPFIDNKKEVTRPAMLGVIFTGFVVFVTHVIAIGYFSKPDLLEAEWATLVLFKSISLPFLDRLDYLIVAEWMMVLLPNFTLLMWGITYGTKRLFNVSQRKTLYTIAILLTVAASFVKYENQIITVTDFVSTIGFWLIFIYPLLLLPIVFIKKKWQQKKEGSP